MQRDPSASRRRTHPGLSASTGTSSEPHQDRRSPGLSLPLPDDDDPEGFLIPDEDLEEEVEAINAADFERALAEDPGNREILHDLLDFYTEQNQWKEAVHTMNRLLQSEDNAQIRGRLHYAAAVALRDQLSRSDLALERFDLALDEEPQHLKAFAAIDTILTKARNWGALERAYRKMINRLPTDDTHLVDLRVQLWKNLGEIYRSRIGNFEKAVVAYDIVTRLRPGDVETRRILAELYDSLTHTPSQSNIEFGDRQAEQHHALIQNQPGQIDSYRFLFNYYCEQNDPERALAFAAILCALRKANGLEQQFFEQRRPKGLLDPQTRLSPRTIERCVAHPDQDPDLTAIFALAAPAVGSLFARPVSAISELTGAERARDSFRYGPLIKAVQYAQAVLGVPMPLLFAQQQNSGVSDLVAIRSGHTTSPALVAYRELIADEDPNQLSFSLVRSLGELQPAYFAFVASGRSLEGLRQLFYACLAVSDMYRPTPGSIAEGLARQLVERVDTVRLNQLRALVARRADPSQNNNVDLTQWIGATRMTLNRLGLLLCGDLPKASRVLARETQRGYAPVSTKHALQDLFVYAVSEPYLQARDHLGLSRASAKRDAGGFRDHHANNSLLGSDPFA